MPDWRPHTDPGFDPVPLDPVRFDHAAAQAAIAEARASLWAITVLAETEQSAASTANTNWVGTARDATDARLARHAHANEEIAAHLRQLVLDLTAAIDDAAAEQLRRDQLRQRLGAPQ